VCITFVSGIYLILSLVLIFCLYVSRAEYESRPNAERRMSQQEQSDEEEADAIDDYYEMDNYDDEPTEAMSGTGIENLILENPPESDSEDSDAEPDEFTVKADDNLILVGHVDDDVTMLEVYGKESRNQDTLFCNVLTFFISKQRFMGPPFCFSFQP